MLANNKKHNLIEHLKATASLAKTMAEKLGLSDTIQEKIYIAALLHDLGKAVKRFQDYMSSLSNYIVDDYSDGDVDNPLHHEISWAYLTKKINDEQILNAVYWHHARPINIKLKKINEYNDADTILKSVSENDLFSLDNLFNTLNISNNYIISSDVNKEIPNLFKKDIQNFNLENSEFMLIRGCVISADRCISSLENLDNINNDNIIKDILSGNILGDISTPENYDEKRFQRQQDIVTFIESNKTSIVKAPAGFGKTIIGILWAKKNNQKTIWVCPRNIVAETVYENIENELTALKLNCSIELYLTGQRKKTNINNERPIFDSDIIITNIDSLMSPLVNNGVAERLFTIHKANVICDEFHEIVSDDPLFAAFIIYMRSRHNICKGCNTLLLSATPSIINLMWDTDDNKTQILPNEREHYEPQHDGYYELNFSDKLPEEAVKGSLLVCNSVSLSQHNYKFCKYTNIIHSKYTTTDRKQKDENLKSFFGKNKTGVVDGESLSAALVVQAAMDISFLHLYDSVCSPESTLQRIGRVDRWGTFQSMKPTINFINTSYSKAENGAINTVYSKELQKEWLNFLERKLKNQKQNIDLKELYSLYNEFYTIPSIRILVKNYINTQYRNGMNGPCGNESIGLFKFQPKKYVHSTSKNKNKKHSKSLRSPGTHYYFTIMRNDTKEWLKPDDVLNEDYMLYERYKNNGSYNSKLLSTGGMRTRLKTLVKEGYVEWKKYIKGSRKFSIPDNIKDRFKLAKDEDTPLPDFTRTYDPNLGIIES
jgi:CRISPR-associated endonuclease Cas3-HD